MLVIVWKMEKKYVWHVKLMKLFKMSYQPRLKTEYKERVTPRLSEEFGYKNVMQVPKLQKIVLSRGVGAAVADKKLVDHAVDAKLIENHIGAHWVRLFFKHPHDKPLIVR